jgi:Protein of unknown function (DUF3141)
MQSQPLPDRHPVADPSPDNPFLQLQTTVSKRIIAALDAWRDVRDRTVEQMFLRPTACRRCKRWSGYAPPMRACGGSLGSSQGASHSFESGSVRSRRRLARARRDAPAVIRGVVSAAGEITGERARRLERIDSLG